MGLERGRERKGRIRLSDVARRVGVSAITVSRALSDPEKVSAELRQVILQAVDEMGYVPNLAARALASRHSGVIGVLVPAMNLQLLAEVMKGIEERVQSTNLRLHYTSTRLDIDEEERSIRAFLAQKPAGLILIGSRNGGAGGMLASACPIVNIADLDSAMDTPMVGIRHRGAAESAIRFLIGKGYRRIGLIRGHAGIPRTEVHDGYEKAMQEAGLHDPSLVAAGQETGSVALGSRLLSQLLEQAPDIDAVLCHNDDLALGVLFECQRRGISVPDQIGICGFYDLEFSASTYPPLTTVHVPRYDAGYRAADMLVRAIESDELVEASVELDFAIVERGTTR